MPRPAAISDAAASVQHLPAVEENATNDRQRRDEVCLVMALNDGGVPPILAQKHYAQPSAFSPGRIDGDLEKGEADGSHDALPLIAIAGDRLRSRLLP
jgi:hypothetical protein